MKNPPEHLTAGDAHVRAAGVHRRRFIVSTIAALLAAPLSADAGFTKGRGGQAREVMSGLNWYWNRYVRMQFNLGWADASGGPRPGNYVVLQTRIDLMI